MYYLVIVLAFMQSAFAGADFANLKVGDRLTVKEDMIFYTNQFTGIWSAGNLLTLNPRLEKGYGFEIINIASHCETAPGTFGSRTTCYRSLVMTSEYCGFEGRTQKLEKSSYAYKNYKIDFQLSTGAQCVLSVSESDDDSAFLDDVSLEELYERSKINQYFF